MKIHWAGEISYVNAEGASCQIFSGWAACCFGPRARKIRAQGNHTYEREKVDCMKCLTMLAKHDKNSAVNGSSPTEGR